VIPVTRNESTPRTQYPREKTLKVDVNGTASKDDETVEVVSSAAHWLRRAAVSAKADSADGATVQPSLASNGTQDDTEEASKNGYRIAVSLLNTVTALNGSSVALAIAGNGNGSRKEGGGEESDGR
jgi:flagellar hook assembly protein FlgD